MSKLNNWFSQIEDDDDSFFLKPYFEDDIIYSILYGTEIGAGSIYTRGLINGDGTLSIFTSNAISEDINNFHLDRNNLHLIGYGVGDGIGHITGFGSDDIVKY